MSNRILIGMALLGVLFGIGNTLFQKIRPNPQPPAFKPASNPYPKGIYANGIIESAQSSGSNVNIYPEVSGTVTRVLVAEGEKVRAGTPLLELDDRVQRATAESANAQVEVASATLATVQAQYAKLKASWELDPRSVSTESLDTSANAVRTARAGVELARKQSAAAEALLSKYRLKAVSDGTILSVNTSAGSFISSQGGYNTYTGGFAPVIVMGSMNGELAVRCYVDEILIQRLPDPSKMHARMTIRGTNITVPLKFVRFQPNVSPKIELSSQRTERVDVRVLPILFGFAKPQGVTLYPGQLVDIYIGEEAATRK